MEFYLATKGNMNMLFNIIVDTSGDYYIKQINLRKTSLYKIFTNYKK